MSFRGDDQRYGHVPPVQYPVPGGQGQPPQPQYSQQAAAYDDPAARYNEVPQMRSPAFPGGAPGPAGDELFLANPAAAGNRSAYGSSSTAAFSGYQHQYQDATPPTPSHASYNPQTFAQTANFPRSQSTSTLPYRHHQQPPTRYASTASSYTPSPPAAAAGYTPQTYNPAAYAAGSAVAPQRQSSHAGYNSYGHGYSASSASLPTTQSSPVYGRPTSSSYSSMYSPDAASQGFEQSPPIGGPPPSTATPTFEHHQYYSQSQSQYSAPASNGAEPSPPIHTGTSQAPYPTEVQIPVGPYYSAHDQNSPYGRTSRSNSQASPVASPPVLPPQSSPGLQRHPTNAPLPRRPLDDGSSWNRNDSYSDEHVTQESIMNDIEAELGRPPANGQYDDDEIRNLQRFDSDMTTVPSSATRTSSNQTGSHLDDDDDDPEGTAGVLAMQQAERDEARFSGSTFNYVDMPALPATASSGNLSSPPEEQNQSSDSDLGATDLGMFSGGYHTSMPYGAGVGSPPASAGQDGSRPLPSPGQYNPGYENGDHGAGYPNTQYEYGDTGGLQPPTAHRLSFDEGEESASLHSLPSGAESPYKDESQDLFYYPASSSRPLPAIPPGPGSDSSSLLSPQNSLRQSYQQHRYSQSTSSTQADNPEAYYSYASSTTLVHPERSISLTSHSHSPQVQAPARSRTDAAEERRKLHRQQYADQEGSNSSVAAFDGITLPSGRKKKFVPSKLTAADFRRCAEPWALSGLEAWIRDMAEGEPDLKSKAVEEALINLFTGKIPMMNVADAEILSTRVVSIMLEKGVLIPDEEWVKFGIGRISGVLWQLTGSGCYAPKLHETEIPGRCYSYHCTRTLKKVDLGGMMPDDAKPADEWHVFYKLKKEDWESKPKKEVDRQNILHEIVTGEENYIKQLDIFRKYYRDELRNTNPPILKPERRDNFLEQVFGKLDTVQEINKDHLLAQLKYRQQEQGPWITGFSDLFRAWIRKAKSIYIQYAFAYPVAAYTVRNEISRNILFKAFLEERQRRRLASKHDWTHYLITPLQRLQRYILLLESVEHKMIGDSEEKTNLNKAIMEIKSVTHECDAKVAERTKRVEMMELSRMLVLRPGFHAALNLDHLDRELVRQGELQRMGSKGVRWVDTHALLFDNFFILAKALITKDGRGEKKFDISREPIHMRLLFIESVNDEAVIKQKGITAPLGRAAAAAPQSAVNLAARPGLEHTMTNNSVNSVGSGADSENRILYPFKVKHLGHEVYTLYASSAQDRSDWCEKLVETRTKFAKSLFSQNAEPFRLRVLADAAFHYDQTSPYMRLPSVPSIKGTPLDRAIEELESVLGPAQGIAPVSRSQVNCATGFTAYGKSVIAIGTDYGVYISEPTNPRGWHRTIQATKVTQIAVLEDFSVCLVITNKELISYPLDVVAPVAEFAAPLNDNQRRAPHRLAKDVTYFATAKMKDRMLLFYKRKEGLHTSFKVLEPIFQKSNEKRSRLFGGRRPAGGATETFRDFDEFFFPTECYSLSLFQTYIAVSTAKGIEMLTLDKKQPMSIPDTKGPAIAGITNRIANQRPLGMFRLNENEFILTYEDCAVYVDKHGEVSRTLIMEYSGKQKKAKGATMYGQYLVLFNDNYIEVRNAENGRLRQIIAGHDVRVLDYGARGPTGSTTLNPQSTQANGHLQGSKGTLKIAMAHPELPGRQIVLEMLLNDGHTER